MEKLYTVVFMFNKGLYLNLSAVLFVFALDKKEAETKAKEKMDDRYSGYQVMQIVQVDDCLIIEAYNKMSKDIDRTTVSRFVCPTQHGGT